MPAALDTTEPALCVVRLSGEVTLEETLAVVNALVPHVRPGVDILVDGTAVVRPLKVWELGVLANDLRKLRSRGLQRVAVASPKLLVREIARVFGSFVSVIEIKLKVFHTLEEAQAWLRPAKGENPAAK